MSQSFLKDQLKRIQDMTEQMARVHAHTTELSHELERADTPHRHPLAEVRDLRTYSSPSYDEPDGPDERHREGADSRSARRHVARDSRRRRHR